MDPDREGNVKRKRNPQSEEVDGKKSGNALNTRTSPLKEYALLIDLLSTYPWMLPIHFYKDEVDLLSARYLIGKAQHIFQTKTLFHNVYITEKGISLRFYLTG